ncbi:MAG: flagellar filament capping protein FliD [Planctomycetota bacterium]|jgi:flagellar hook-associated protein 2
MADLRLPGLLTGIDTNVLVAQLMAIERRRLNMYEERKSLWEERQDALSTLETKLSTLRSSVRALSDAGELRAFSTASSDTDKLTADATYNAFEGNHTVVINQLATAERWVHTDGLEYAEDYVGEGVFIYSYNHKETSITTTSTTTLEDLVGLINNDANNPGVTASLLYYNNAYHLVLNGDDAGSDYSISINTGSTEVWKSDSELTYDGDNATLATRIIDLDDFSGTRDDDDVIEIRGTDHFGVALPGVDLSVTDNTTIGHLISEINDAFDGRAKAVFEDGKIILTDSTCGASSLSITLTYNNNGSGGSLNLPMGVTTEGNATTASLLNFAVSDFIKSQAAQDSKIKVDGFPSTSAVSEVQTASLDASPTGGTFTLTYRGQTTDAIQWDAGAATIKAELEKLSTVNADDIMVSGSLDDGTTFTFASSLGDVDLLMIDGSGLTGPSTCSIAETTQGSDGYVSRSSNTIDDVIYGVTLHLHDITDSGGEQITLTRDVDSVKEKLHSFVDAYNFAIEYIKAKTGYNDVLQTGGVLMGDYVVSTISSQLRTPLISRTSGFVKDIDTYLMPGQIGLELDRDGVLSLNTNVFDEAIAADYMDVLAIIGADKTGSSDSNDIQFYGASDNYTTAGEYDVQVDFDGGGNLSAVRIKLSTESSYRNMTVTGNIAIGDSTFDDNGDPLYPENGLQITVPTTGTPITTIGATVRVKQGFAGAMEDALQRMLKATTGSIQIDQEHVDDQIEYLQDRIEDEEDRLVQTEARLVARFARLEKTLALIQNQLAALGLNTI